MQRRLNKRLSEKVREARFRQEEETVRDSKGPQHRVRDKSKLGSSSSPRTRSGARFGVGRGRTTFEVPVDLDADVEEGEVEDSEYEDDNEGSFTRVAKLAYPSAPEQLPLDDQEFEEEFGQDLLNKAFIDSDRGSQRDLPVRGSRSRGGGQSVEMQFVNKKMGASFLQGVSSTNSEPQENAIRTRGDTEPEPEEDDFGEADEVSLRHDSSSSLVGGSRIRIGRSSDRGSASSLRSISRDSFGRRTSSRKLNDDDDMLGAESAIPNDIEVGYSRSSPRLGGRGASRLSPKRSHSREVAALPIEIPDSVTDEDAFRRYLSVRRGAHIEIRHHLPFEDIGKSYSSLGEGGRLPPSMRSSANANARLDANRKMSCLCFAIVSLALLSASASQLRFVVAYSKAHAYPALNYFLICVSMIIEIVAGVGYIMVSRLPATDPRVDNIIGILIAGLFVVAINNVIISAFAFDDHVCEVLAKQTGMLDVIDQTPNQNQNVQV